MLAERRRLSRPAGCGGSHRSPLTGSVSAGPQALDNYHKADADFNLSRAEVEKQKMNSSLRDQQCEDNKNEYANQLQKTNDLQVGAAPTA